MFEQYIPNDYFRFAIILVGLLIILRIAAFIAERTILKLVKKTKTDIDDVFIKKSSMPITLLVTLICLRVALNEIELDSAWVEPVSKVIYSFLIILVAVIVYIVFEVIVFHIWKKIIKRANAKTIESLSSVLRGILKTIIIVITLLYILSLWGVEVTPILAGLGIAGIAISLALQPTLSNVFSGISLILDDSIRVGDLVYLDNDNSLKGKIQSIGLRSTKIVTFDNELVIVPNGKLAESNIQNIALPKPKSRVVVGFCVAYGADIGKVKEIILKEINSIKLACKDPAPIVRFIEMAESSLNFKAYFYVESFEDRWTAIDEANTKIYNALRKNKIEIPFKQLDVHLRKE
ncbi:MAG: mechanosensitive ion channel family protein [Candidatus Pacearchaeota archaeon]|jgi:MscS family membrane protein